MGNTWMEGKKNISAVAVVEMFGVMAATEVSMMVLHWWFFQAFAQDPPRSGFLTAHTPCHDRSSSSQGSSHFFLNRRAVQRAKIHPTQRSLTLVRTQWGKPWGQAEDGEVCCFLERSLLTGRGRVWCLRARQLRKLNGSFH